MTRIYDADGFRTIEPSEKHPGATALRLDENRDVIMPGVGPEVRAALLAWGRSDG